jgi:hypothetical protein
LPSSGVGLVRPSSRRTVGVIGPCGHVSGEGVDVYLDFRATRKAMRGTIRDNLNPLALDPVAVRDPNTLAVAVTTVGIASIRVGLLHCPVGIEEILFHEGQLDGRKVRLPGLYRPTSGGTCRQGAAAVL